MPERKALTSLKVKDEDAGIVEACFATFNVIDKDGDVTIPGAFTDGEQVKISDWNHTSWEGARPVGRGEIRQTDTEAIMSGQFFMDTTAGRDAFAVVKGLGDLCEWSYGFDVIERDHGKFGEQDVQFLRKLKVHEASPVILGAGVGTRTLAMKAGKLKLVDHTDAVLTDVTGLIDRVVEVKGLRDEQGKTLGTDSRMVLERLDEQMKRLREVLATAPRDDHKQTLEREFARFVRLRANL